MKLENNRNANALINNKKEINTRLCVHLPYYACYGRDKLLARAINLIVAGWRSSGLPAWESIVFIYHTPRSLAPHMTPLLAFGACAHTT